MVRTYVYDTERPELHEFDNDQEALNWLETNDKLGDADGYRVFRGTEMTVETNHTLEPSS